MLAWQLGLQRLDWLSVNKLSVSAFGDFGTSQVFGTEMYIRLAHWTLLTWRLVFGLIGVFFGSHPIVNAARCADMRYLTFKVLLVALSSCVISLSVCVVSAHGADSLLGQVDRLAALYRIKIQTSHETFPVTNNHGQIEGANPNQQALLKYLPLFFGEFTLYPQAVIERAGLKAIVLCERLKFAGQLRSSIPDYLHDTLYYDVSRGSETPDYKRNSIHHEFFHIIDWKDDGLVYQDQVWAALNPPGFKYGSGGKNAQNDSTVGVVTDSLKGFLTRYAMTGVEEDKAETFSHMMISYRMVEQRTKHDPVLKAKFDYIKVLCQKFSSTMDDAFWKRMSERSQISGGAIE